MQHLKVDPLRTILNQWMGARAKYPFCLGQIGYCYYLKNIWFRSATKGASVERSAGHVYALRKSKCTGHVLSASGVKTTVNSGGARNGRWDTAFTSRLSEIIEGIVFKSDGCFRGRDHWWVVARCIWRVAKRWTLASWLGTITAV